MGRRCSPASLHQASRSTQPAITTEITKHEYSSSTDAQVLQELSPRHAAIGNSALDYLPHIGSLFADHACLLPVCWYSGPLRGSGLIRHKVCSNSDVVNRSVACGPRGAYKGPANRIE